MAGQGCGLVPCLAVLVLALICRPEELAGAMLIRTSVVYNSSGLRSANSLHYLNPFPSCFSLFLHYHHQTHRSLLLPLLLLLLLPRKTEAGKGAPLAVSFVAPSRRHLQGLAALDNSVGLLVLHTTPHDCLNRVYLEHIRFLQEQSEHVSAILRQFADSLDRLGHCFAVTHTPCYSARLPDRLNNLHSPTLYTVLPFF